MLSKEQDYILDLLRKSAKCATDNTVSLEDIDVVGKYVVNSGILLTVYSSMPEPLESMLRQKYFALVRQSVCQEYEGQRVLNALNDAGLSCIALKGWEIRKLYPQDAMRQMSDLDILVKPYEYDRIRSVMTLLGFTSGSESGWKHDSFMKGQVHVEMHKRLTDDSEEIQRWECDMWTRAVPVEGNIFKMSPEDYCIFHFVHLHKDFLNGKLGLRRVVDTWLLSKQSVDTNIVRKYLEKFGMGTFYERMIHLARATMGEEPMDENSELLLKHAFTYGIYGTDRSYKAGRIAVMGSSVKAGKLKSALAAMFLPYKRMKAQFPVLERHPILLPWYWLKRAVGFLKGGIMWSVGKLDYKRITKEDFEHMKRFFEAGGIRTSQDG